MGKDKKPSKPTVPVCHICNQPMTSCACKHNELKK
jgi:hypothetical protein